MINTSVDVKEEDTFHPQSKHIIKYSNGSQQCFTLKISESMVMSLL